METPSQQVLEPAAGNGARNEEASVLQANGQPTETLLSANRVAAETGSGARSVRAQEAKKEGTGKGSRSDQEKFPHFL